MCFFVGLTLIESRYSEIGFWGMNLSIWLVGLVIFSRLFALTEDTLVGNEYAKYSLVRNSSVPVAIFYILFISAWFAGLIVLTGILLQKTIA